MGLSVVMTPVRQHKEQIWRPHGHSRSSVLGRNGLSCILPFSIVGWELSGEERNPLLKAEVNSDEANCLAILFTPGSESFGCEWCISMSTTIPVSNTIQSIFKFTSYPVTLFVEIPTKRFPSLPSLSLSLILEKNLSKSSPDDFPVSLWPELNCLSRMGQEQLSGQ